MKIPKTTQHKSFCEIYKLNCSNKDEAAKVVNTLSEDKTIFAKQIEEGGDQVLLINGKEKEDRTNLINSLSKIFKSKNISCMVDNEYANKAMEIDTLECVVKA